MKVTIEFDPKDLDSAQRFLLHELMVGELPLPPLAATDEPELPLGKPESQKSPTILDTEAAIAANREAFNKAISVVNAAAKTEIVGDSKLEGFVPPKRGRKSKAEQVEKAAEEVFIAAMQTADRVAGTPTYAEVMADGEFVAATTSAMEQRHAAERIEPPLLDPAAIGGDDDFVAVPVITDKDMHNACAAKMAKRQRDTIATEIRALVGTYVQAGQNVAMIPQSARAGFLDKLAAL